MGSQDFLISFIANVVSANGDAEKHWDQRSAGVNMDTVVSGLQQKLQNLKAQGQKNESSAAVAATLTTTEETGDFKMALRKFSQQDGSGQNQPESLPKIEKSKTKKTEEENGIKIVNGKEEFTIDFDKSK